MSDNMIYYQSQPFIPIGSRVGQAAGSNSQGLSVNKTSKTASFEAILSAKMDTLQFSQHAKARMQARNIQLTDEEMQKLNTAVDKMAQKGAKESLVYLNDNAFVVSITNKTVITAMDGSSARDNIFTNIDSAVII